MNASAHEHIDPAAKKPSRTFGIDLGTTYSCISYVDDSGRPTIVKNAIGEDTTPSVVFFETEDNVIVGRIAKNSQKTNPELVASLIKRDMGEKTTLSFHGTEHSPESISALILREIAAAATAELGEPVHDVVITVPAYFGVSQREATRHAGEIAGLNVVDVVPEPVAAALHYEAAGGGDRTILVYDLGGGTFDTTVIRLVGDDISVVCTDGDHHLGGADWDERISTWLLECFLAENPASAAGEHEDFLQSLATSAEEMKKALSRKTGQKQPMRFASEVATAELTRERFEQLTADLLERTFDITARTIETATAKGVDHFDDVLLVGGSTRLSAVAAGLRARFGFEPRLHDPDLAVAKGAALFALIQTVKTAFPEGDDAAPSAVAMVADQLGIAPEEVRRLSEKKVVTVAPRAFGIKALRAGSLTDCYVDHLIKANDVLPATPPVQRYATVHPDQTNIRIEVWEQAGAVASADLEHNNRIGEGNIANLPPLPKGSPIDVTFNMAQNGTLRVHAVETTTGGDLDIELLIGGLNRDEVAQARDAVARYSVGG
ncbi:Hsp70 family protein [Amycolatopsis sp. NPDC101161]|uniref:Hsp70 family protein n=1 Tax=Amycolatopsis sp. NPDC101161 TaxID=3363940 RepID=UPI003806B3C2